MNAIPQWISELSSEEKEALDEVSLGINSYNTSISYLTDSTFPDSLAKYFVLAGREAFGFVADVSIGLIQGKPDGKIAMELVGGYSGAQLGAIIGAPFGPAGSAIGAVAVGTYTANSASDAYDDITALSNSAEVQNLQYGKTYLATTADLKTYQCYKDENNILTIEEFSPADLRAEAIRNIRPFEATFLQKFTDNSTLSVTVDESGKAIKELKFNSSSVSTGSEIDDLADSFNVDESDTPLIKDGAKIISEDSNGTQDEQIFNHGDIANMFKADGLSLDDPTVATKKLNPDGSVSYSLAPPSAQLNDDLGNSFSLGNVASMVFGRDGAITNFIEGARERYTDYYHDPVNEAAYTSAVINMATRIANGEDFDTVVATTVAAILATPEINHYLDKLMGDADLPPTTTYETYLRNALTTFLVTSIVNGGEDLAQTAQHVSVQQATEYALTYGFKGTFSKQAFLENGQPATDINGNPLYQINTAGAAAAAAVVSLGMNVLNGETIGEEQIGQAAIAAGTTAASLAIGGMFKAGGLLANTQFASSAAQFLGLSKVSALAGPAGMVAGFAISLAISKILEPKVYDDTTQSHKTVDNGDGSVTLTGLREAGSLLRTTGDANDDFTGNDSADDTSGHDVIVGQAGANEIYALGGHDFIEGRANADYIEAGTGNDHVEAGSGDDFVDGGAGSDKIYGQGGDDNIIGGDGEDILLGGAGDDLLEGGADNDKIFGAEGDDTVSGGAGDDEVSGGAGADTLSGDAGNDTIDAGDGDDDIFGDDGDDVIYAGAGSDTARGGNDNDTIFGETGVDMLYGNAGDDIIDGGNQDDLVFGGIGSDTIMGGYGDDDLYGEIGNDLLVGGRDDDTLDGGDGDDVYMYSTGDGNDTITETDGNNVIKFTDIDVADVAFTEVGNDLVLTINGSNTITVQDYFVTSNLEEIEFADERRVVMTDVSFAAGVGTVNAIQNTGSAYVTALSSNIRNVAVVSSPWLTNALPSTTWFTNNYDTNADPSTWDAEIYNDVQVRIWNKSAGLFSLKKSMGFYDYHEKYLKGSAVDDRIVGMWWGETISGEAGNDQLYGNVDVDIVNGGAEHDLIFGGEGSDTLNGGSGTDMIMGGHGLDNIDGGNGNDTIFGEWGNDTISGGLGDDFAEGGLGNDTLHGNEGDDLLFGNEGDDTIQGGEGNDYLYGGDGADDIYAGIGNDLILGGAGNDTIDGDDGFDTAVFSGRLEDYNITINSEGAITVEDTIGNDGTDTLTGVETLQFADGEYDVYNIFPNHPTAFTFAQGSSFAGQLTLPAGYTISLVQGPTTGTLNFNADGTFDYTSSHTTASTDQFVYKMTSPIGSEQTYTASMNLVTGSNAFEDYIMSEEEQTGFFKGAATTADYYDSVKVKSSALSGGGHVDIWSLDSLSYMGDTIGDGDGQGVVAQIYDADNNILVENLVINSNATGEQSSPDVIATSDGGFWAAWSSNTGSSYDNYMQKFNANGLRVGSEVLISSNAGDQTLNRIEELSNDSIAVTWTSEQGGNKDVYTRIFTSTGVSVTSEILVNATSSADQTLATITALSNGSYVVAWEDQSNLAGNGSEIRARIFSNTGAALTSELHINNHITSDQGEPAVTALTGGDFVVTWKSLNQDGSGYGIYARQYSSTGAAIGNEFIVNTTTSSQQYEVDMTALSDGGYFITWVSYGQDGDGNGIYGQRFDEFGSKVGAETRINQQTSSHQNFPSVIELSNGDIMMTWMDFNGSPASLKKRRLIPNNTGISSGIIGQFGTDDIIVGGTSSDSLYGLSGDDTLSGGNGNDTLDGGDGNDTAVYSGNFADYTISGNGSTFTVTDNVGTEGTDTLVNMEQVQFADTTLNLELEFPDHPSLLKSAQNSITSGQLELPAGYTVSIVTAPSTGMLVLNADGSYSYSSVAGDATLDEFTYKVTSPLGIEKVYTMDIEVVNLADAGSSYTAGTETTVGSIKLNHGYSEIHERSRPKSASLQDGGHIIVWSSNNSPIITDGNNHAIVAQRYNKNGAAVGSNFIVNTTTDGGQLEADVIGLQNGGFVVSWSSSSSGSSDSQFGNYFQMYNSAGTKVGGEVHVNTSTPNHQLNPRIELLTDGRFVIAWASNHTGNYRIYHRIFNENGTAATSETQVNTFVNNTQHYPVVAALEAGGYVIAWEDKGGSDGNGHGIKARMYSASGTPTTSEFRVNTYTNNNQDNPAITGLADGGFVVTWDSKNQDGNYEGIYMQRYNGSGVKVGAEQRVNIYTNSNQLMSDVVALSDGGYFIVWASRFQDGQDFGVYGQRYNMNGSKIGSEIRINSTINNIQTMPSVSETENGSLIISWMDFHTDLDPIRQKILVSDGTGGVLLKGFSGESDFITGGAYGDHIYGEDGNDVLTGNAGNDAIDGGTGTDTAVFSGNLADYNISLAGNTITVQDTVGTDGTDTLTNIEALQFADGTFDVAATFPDQLENITSAQGGMYEGQLDVPVGYSAALVTAPTSGTFVLNADGSYTYTAPNGTVGTETFSYKIISPFGIEKTYTTTVDIHRVADGGDSYTDNGETVLATQELINNWTDVRERMSSKVAALSGGGHVTTWATFASTDPGHVNDGAESSVIAQIFDTNGNAVVTEFVVNTATAGYQSTPSVTALSDGGFIVAWGTTLGPVSAGVQDAFMQRYNSSGVKVGGETRINTSLSTQQYFPAVTELEGGNIAVSWASEHNGTWDIFYKVYNANLSVVLEESQANTHNSGTQDYPIIASLKDGGFVISWEDRSGSDGDSHGVKYRIFNADGTARTGENLANTYSTLNQGEPAITGLLNGDFLIAWTSENQDGANHGVYAQRFTQNGVKVGAEVLINTETTNNQYSPDVTSLSDGGYYIAWTSTGQDGSFDGIYGQRFDASGNAIGTETQLNTNTTDSQSKPSITEAINGNIIVSWMDYNGLSGDIRQKLLVSDGTGGAYISGSNDNDVLIGGINNDTLIGGLGNDDLIGGDGDDTMSGGEGDDTYNVAFNQGDDIIDNGDAAGTDTVMFSNGEQDFSLWFSRSGFDLKVDYLDNNGSLTFKNWYVNDEQKVDAIELDNGTAVNQSGINQLVSAMAGFDPALFANADDITDLPTEVQNAITANWV